MKRLALMILATTLAGACGGAHMGDGYGRRTRAALDGNLASKSGGGGAAIVMGDDAKAILMRHRGLEQTSTLYKSSGLSGAGASSGSSGPSSSTTMPASMGSPGRLDAR